MNASKAEFTASQYAGKIATHEHDEAVPSSSLALTRAGEGVLKHAVELARTAWGQRLVGAYALGSLAHGGFSVHVSDVDLGLVLGEPIVEEDEKTAHRLLNEVKTSGVPLAERLSLFWGSLDTMLGTAAGGRFPPLDLLDMKQFGRLLAGRDIRSQLRTPSLKELIVSGAAFALKGLSTTQTTAYLCNPTELVHAGTRKLTKIVLYPVRFLYTAQTGQIGINQEAVEHFSAIATGMPAELARSALEWRTIPPDPEDHSIVDALRNGLLPLYWQFLEDYERRLREYGELDLARAYSQWRQRLA